MDDPGSGWCTVLALGGWPAVVVMLVLGMFTCIITALNLALRQISWVRLEEALEQHKQEDRLDWYKKNMAINLASTTFMRLVLNVGIILTTAYIFLDPVIPVTEENLWQQMLLTAGVVGLGVLLLFAYALPQACAKYSGTAFLVHGRSILLLIHPLGWGILVPIQWVETLVRRLSGVSSEEGNGKEEKQEELLNVVEEQEKEGVVDEEEREMIESVLEFRNTTAGEIMTPRTDVQGIEAQTDFAEMIAFVRQTGHSRYPVYEESIDKIIGMIFAKDLLKHIGEDQSPEDIRTLLRKPQFVPEGKTLRDLLHDFQNTKSHFAVVLDEYGGTAGVVTIEDILEELVGEIGDEYERPQEEPFVQVNEHTYEVDARYHVDELNDELDLKIPEDEDYETIGGFAFARLGYIPEPGETFEHENLKFTILDAEQRRINRLQVVVQQDVSKVE